MTEDKERKLHSLLAESLYILASCKCIDSSKLSKFIERAKAELPTKLLESKSKKILPNLSQILPNDPTFVAAVENQIGEFKK